MSFWKPEYSKIGGLGDPNGRYSKGEGMITKEEIHNIYLHMSGKAEGIAEATGAADFPVLFANAILEYAKRPWVGLTIEEVQDSWNADYQKQTRAIEAALRSKNT